MSEEQSVLVQPENNNVQSNVQSNAPVQATPIQTVEPKASNAISMPEHYLVTVRGQAAISGGATPQSVFYNETIACPVLGEGKADGHYMTHLLKDEFGESLLAKAIKRKYGHCECIRTHEIISRVYVDAQGNKTEAKNVVVVNGQQYLQVSQMRYAELIGYIEERNYQISAELYPTTDELRNAIDAYEKDKDAFVLAQEKAREDFRIRQDALALEALNNTDASLDI